MAPGVAGDFEALYFDFPDLEDLAIAQQHFIIGNGYLRQLVQMVNDLAADFAGEVAVFCFANIEGCLTEQAGAISFHRADMVGILMGNKNVPDGLRFDAQPAHFSSRRS